MMIEVKGIGFPNKGAELMLVAVQEKLKEAIPDVKFVVEPNTKFDVRNAHGIYSKITGTRFGVNLGLLANALPKRLRLHYGLVADSDIDVILDASGFAYGDQWGPAKAKSRLANHIQKWKKQGKKVVILPQALGPFTDKELAEHMATIVEHADIVYARDDISFKYISELGNGVKQSPDFTNLVKGRLPLDFKVSSKDVCVIPNAKMIQMTSKDTGDKYPKQMADMVAHCQSRGYSPYLLVHEGKKDLELAQKINTLLDASVPVYQYPDAKDIKGIISTAQFVISSRFHGLVSALSQGVPAVATGWSHKYEMLMNDYNCPELLINSDADNVDSILKIVCDPELLSDTKRKIQAESIELKKRSEIMWDDVIRIIKS